MKLRFQVGVVTRISTCMLLARHVVQRVSWSDKRVVVGWKAGKTDKVGNDYLMF